MWGWPILGRWRKRNVENVKDKQGCMDIPISESKRARTRITFYRGGQAIKSHIDDCLIFPDEVNSGCFIALSQQTSKVGWSSSIKDAYIDLIVGIALAFKYAIDNDIDTGIGVSSCHPIWNDEDYEKIHRLQKSIQNTALKQTKRIVEGEHGILRTVYKREEMEETKVDFEAILVA